MKEAMQRINAMGLDAPVMRDSSSLKLNVPPTPAMAKLCLLNVRKSWEIEQHAQVEKAVDTL
eukprot:7500402-Alexandrium_andersonii.AAC.1